MLIFFENWVLRRTRIPKRKEMTGDLRKLNNRVLHNRRPNKYFLRDKVRTIDMGGRVSYI